MTNPTAETIEDNHIRVMFERSQGTFETLANYHYDRDEDQFGGVPPMGGVTWFDAINAAAEDLRVLDVPERVIELHVARMRKMTGCEEPRDLAR